MVLQSHRRDVETGERRLLLVRSSTLRSSPHSALGTAVCWALLAGIWLLLGPSYIGVLAQARPQTEQTQKGSVEVSIDPKIQRTVTELPGLDHGPPRAVGAMLAPEGHTLEFVSNE